MKKFFAVFLVLAAFLGTGFLITKTEQGGEAARNILSFTRRQLGSIGDVFLELFTRTETLEETGASAESKSKEWWLSSSGLFYVDNALWGLVVGADHRDVVGVDRRVVVDRISVVKQR